MFIYFLIASVLFYAVIILINILDNNSPTAEGFYRIILFPGLLLVFYPATYGIQIDDDAKTLEILFGIPNYRYKVWLFRLLLIFAINFIIVFLLTLISHVTMVNLPYFNMSYHLMYSIILVGSMAFMFSTLIRNGNGTAVVVIIVCVALLILGDEIDESQWYIYFNPFRFSDSVTELVWEEKVLKNRLILASFSVVFILFGLFNLQKREKFMK